MVACAKAAFLFLAVAAIALHAGARAAAQEPQGFCARAQASRTCAKPPTVDETESFSVEKYLGKWFEIGSTAAFKLQTETGLVCDQARYSSSASGQLSLINSGLRVIGPLAMAEVAAVNVAAAGACAAARQVCGQLPAVGQLSLSLSNLSSDGAAELLQLSQQLESSRHAAEQALGRLAQDVSLLQRANGDISQAQTSSLQGSVANLTSCAREGEQQQEVVASLASTLSKAAEQAMDMAILRTKGWSLKRKAALVQAALSLGRAALEVGAGSSAIELSLEAARVSGKALAGSGGAIAKGGVRSVSGTITQPNATSAGKLQVGIGGNRAPYWIIALEKAADGGGAAYSAAMVYSCSEAAGKSLFVLSREPQLQKSILNAFLAKAESLGIYNDCEDPFLLTAQRGGDCGQPA